MRQSVRDARRRARDVPPRQAADSRALATHVLRDDLRELASAQGIPLRRVRRDKGSREAVTRKPRLATSVRVVEQHHLTMQIVAPDLLTLSGDEPLQPLRPRCLLPTKPRLGYVNVEYM